MEDILSFLDVLPKNIILFFVAAKWLVPWVLGFAAGVFAASIRPKGTKAVQPNKDIAKSSWAFLMKNPTTQTGKDTKEYKPSDLPSYVNPASPEMTRYLDALNAQSAHARRLKSLAFAPKEHGEPYKQKQAKPSKTKNHSLKLLAGVTEGTEKPAKNDRAGALFSLASSGVLTGLNTLANITIGTIIAIGVATHLSFHLAGLLASQFVRAIRIVRAGPDSASGNIVVLSQYREKQSQSLGKGLAMTNHDGE